MKWKEKPVSGYSWDAAKRVFPVDKLPGAAQTAQCQTHVDHQSQERSWSVGREGEGTVFSHEKRGLQGDLLTICYCLMGGDTDCPQRCTGRKGSIDQSCNMGYYSIRQGRKLFILREVKHWNRSPESLLGFHPWRCSSVLCMALSNLIRWDWVSRMD